MTKEFILSTTCPQCGNTEQQHRNEQDMHAMFGQSKEVHMLCARCKTNFAQPMETACAEWDDYCQEIPLPADV